MRKGSHDRSRKRADFHKFFKEYDARHNLNIREVFPEMQQFFDICEMESNRW
jgi:hypothetical protein